MRVAKKEYAKPVLTAHGPIEKLTHKGGSPLVTDVPQGTIGDSLDDIVGVVSGD